MAAPKAKDPLDALQHLINDVLVQTGKALRASRRDSEGNLVQPPGAMQPKLPDTIQAFHSALDELESDIVRAKSVLLRDLNQLQSNKKDTAIQPTAPQPVESQSKSPMNIDLESSPAAAPEPTPKTTAAPVPAMDVNMGTANGASAAEPATKDEEKTPKAEPQRSTDTSQPETTDVKTDPAPAADDPSSLLDSNFTDMEFTLAPTADDPAQASTTQPESSSAPTFDLTSFETNDNSDNNILSLESLESSTQQQPAQPETATTEAKPDEEKKDASAKFEDIFGNDASQADGMDFDFSLGGGMGDDTFDDLMNDRDGTFEMMNNEDFDAAFFGLDGSNNES